MRGAATTDAMVMRRHHDEAQLLCGKRSHQPMQHRQLGALDIRKDQIELGDVVLFDKVVHADFKDLFNRVGTLASERPRLQRHRTDTGLQARRGQSIQLEVLQAHGHVVGVRLDEVVGAVRNGHGEPEREVCPEAAEFEHHATVTHTLYDLVERPFFLRFVVAA